MVGRLASPVHGSSRKDASHVPLNLSQSSQRSRETQGEIRTAYALNPAESRAHQQQIVQQGHAVILANGQPVLVPLDYHHHHQQQQQPQQQHYQPNDVASAAIVASPATYTKAMDAAACLPERAVAEPPPQQGQQVISAPAPGAFPQAPLLAPTGRFVCAHFSHTSMVGGMKSSVRIIISSHCVLISQKQQNTHNHNQFYCTPIKLNNLASASESQVRVVNLQ